VQCGSFGFDEELDINNKNALGLFKIQFWWFRFKKSNR
jgi:hypothetical protein